MKDTINMLAYQMDPEVREEGLMPEERLLVGIFDRALRDLMFPEKTTPRHVRRSARRYFKSHDCRHLGSFGYFCLHFGLCQEEVRRLVFTEGNRAKLVLLIKTSRRKGH